MVALSTAFVLVLPDMKRFGPELKGQLRKVDVTSSGREAGTRFSSGMAGSTRKAMGRGLAAAGLAVGAAFGAALTKGFGRLSAIENAEAKLTGLGHSAKTVDRIMVNALASVKGTAFGLDEASTLAATAVAAGIKPGRELERTLKLVADAATIGGTSLSDMGAIFNQVAASNKVQGDTINQLNERGIPILKLLADVTGKSQAEVSALASKGKIDFATFQKAMEQGLGGAALKSGNTATGAFKNMGAAFSRVGAALLKGVFPQIGTGFGLITKALDAITPGAARFGEAFGRALTRVGDVLSTQVLPAMRTFGGFVQTNVVPVLQSVGDFVRANVLPALKTLGQYVVTTLLPAWLSWYSFLIAQMMPILKRIGGFVVDSVIPAFRTVAKFIATDVVPGFLSIVDTVKDLIRVVAPIIRDIVGVIIDQFGKMRPQIESIWTSVKEIITGVMFIIEDVIRAVTTIIRLIWDRHGDQIKKIVGGVFGAIFKIIAGVMKAIAGVIKLFVALIKGDWRAAWDAIKQIFSGVWQAIRTILVGALRIINANMGGFITTVTGRWSALWTRVKDSTRAAMDWVHNKISTVLGRIRGAFQTTKDNIGRVWAGVRGVVSAPIEWVKNNVYNRPLVPVWNRVASLVNGPKLAAYARGGIADLEAYANGGTPFGVRPGYTPGRDNQIIRVGGGEAIMRPEWTRAAGADYVNAANAAARRGVSSARRFIGEEGLPPGFQTGGVVGWIRDKLGSAGAAVSGLAAKMKDWVLGGLSKAASAILTPLKGAIDRNMPASGVGRTVGGLGHKAINLILDKIKGVDVAPVTTGAPGGSIATVPGSGWGAIMAAMRAHGARSFTTYPGHHPTMERARDVTPHNWAAANAARSLSGVWYVIYRMMIASKNHGNVWRPYRPTNFRGDWRHVRHIHVARYSDGGLVPQLKDGGLVKGGRGGIVTRIGEGANDELVTPLPRNWQARHGDDGIERLIAAIKEHDRNITLNFGDIHNPREEALSQTANKILQRVAALPLV